MGREFYNFYPDIFLVVPISSPFLDPQLNFETSWIEVANVPNLQPTSKKGQHVYLSQQAKNFTSIRYNRRDINSMMFWIGFCSGRCSMTGLNVNGFFQFFLVRALVEGNCLVLDRYS